MQFLDAGKKYLATVYRDADNADWKNNPEAYVIEKFIVTDKTKMNIAMAPGGGFAVSLMPATKETIAANKPYKNKK